MQIIKYAFQQHGDERGMLVALERSYPGLSRTQITGTDSDLYSRFL